MKMNKELVIVKDQNVLNYIVSVFREMKFALISVIVEIVKITSNIKTLEKKLYKTFLRKIPLLLIKKFLSQNPI